MKVVISAGEEFYITEELEGRITSKYPEVKCVEALERHDSRLVEEVEKYQRELKFQKEQLYQKYPTMIISDIPGYHESCEADDYRIVTIPPHHDYKVCPNHKRWGEHIEVSLPINKIFQDVRNRLYYAEGKLTQPPVDSSPLTVKYLAEDLPDQISWRL